MQIAKKQFTKPISWLKEVMENFHSETEQTWKMLSNHVQTWKWALALKLDKSADQLYYIQNYVF